jgi:hypothetical protein
MKTDIFGGYIGACLAVVMMMMMMLTQSAEALTCYSCTSGVGVGSNCKYVNNSTGTITCSDGCQTVITTAQDVVSRSCGTINTGCVTVAGYKGCSFSCQSNLCNTQLAAPPSVRSASAAVLLSLAALIALSNFV